MKTIVQNTLVAAVAVIVCLFLVEAGIRTFAPQPTGPSQFVFDPARGDIPVPNQHGRRILPGVYDYTYANNSLGLRGPEIDFERKDARRVLLLGDSFTYGIGVNDDQTFAALVGCYLASRKPPYETVNGGDPGTGTDYALKFYRTLGERLKPKLVALFFFANDFEDNAFAKYYAAGEDGRLSEKNLSGSVGSRKQLLSSNRLYNWLISWSHTANLLKQFAINLMLRGKVESGQPSSAVVSYKNEGGYSGEANVRITGVLLGALKDAVTADGANLVVFYVPARENVAYFRDKGAVARDEAAANQIAGALGIPFYSLTPVLASRGEDLSGLYFAEGHWNALAHRIAAGVIADVLAERLDKISH